jgi:hypothetical protein
LLDTTGNPKWVQEYLLTFYPARDVELPAFAIAKQPVTNALYRQFMAETGATDKPSSWRRGDTQVNQSDDQPAVGLSWWQALAICEWAGARLPFEDEWERAARGPEHRLYPWGSSYELAQRIWDNCYPTTLSPATSRTPDGLEGAVCGQPEWCADNWSVRSTADPAAWGVEDSPGWMRVLRGGGGADTNRFLPAATTRASSGHFSLRKDTAQIRLVRGDGRVIPPPLPTMPASERAMELARVFDGRTVSSVIASLGASAIGNEHTINPDPGRLWDERDVKPLARPLYDGCRELWGGLSRDPAKWVIGSGFYATSRETIRRVPPEHGVFAWAIQYRVAENGELRARPIAAFRMAFDKSIHRFENRFRPSEPDSAVASLTPELVRASIVDAFQFYEIHADSDEDPFAKRD